MSPDQAVELARGAVVLTLLLSVPIMGVATLVGLLISIAQAVTQIQDQTISFVPKIVTMVLVLVVCLPWLIQRMTIHPRPRHPVIKGRTQTTIPRNRVPAAAPSGNCQQVMMNSNSNRLETTGLNHRKG